MGCHTSKSSYALTSNSYTAPVSAVVLQSQTSPTRQAPPVKTGTSKASFREDYAGETTHQLQRQLTKKAIIVPDISVFHTMDLHARNTPNEISTSVDRLVTYLMSYCTNSLNTVRIFYMWICTHIRYNRSPVTTNDLHKFNAHDVLTKRHASLAYTNLLFHHFCQLTSIPCVLVHGVLKGAGREPASLLRYRTVPNHVWSLVLVAEQWRFVDCACGRGLQDDPRHAEVMREFYFLPDPECLIITHFPLGMSSELLPLTPMGDNFRKGVGRTSVQIREGLQMLPSPLKFGQFCQQATPTVVAMELGLELMSHKHAHVTVCRGELFSLRCAGFRLGNMAALLRNRETNAEYKQTVLCTRHGVGEDFRVFVKPSRCGNFRLSIYGQASNVKDDSFHLLVDYYLKVEEVEGKDVERGETFLPFPEHFGVWGANDLAPRMGFSKRIYKFDVLACRTGDLYLKLPVSGFVRAKAMIIPASDLSNGAGGRSKGDTNSLDKKDDSVSLLSVSYKSSDGYEGGKFGSQILISRDKKKLGSRLLVKSREGCSTLTQYTENVVHVRGRFAERGFYSLSLLAQNPEPEPGSGSSSSPVAKFTKVADFLVSCQRASPYISRRAAVGAASGPYPKTFPEAQTHQCLLLQPLARDLTLGVTVTFKLRSRRLTHVKVENEAMLSREEYRVKKRQERRKGLYVDLESVDTNQDNDHYRDCEDNESDDDCDVADDNQEGELWCLDYTPKCPGASVCVYGCGHPEQGEEASTYSALYMFQVGYLSVEQLKRQRKMQRCTDSDTDTEIISIMTKM